MKTENIEAYAEVVRSGSLTLAATRLGVSQSLLTRHVQAFEDELGVELLDRRIRPLQPTALGLRVSEECHRVLAAIERLKEVAAVEAAPRGSFRFGATQGIGEILFPELIDELTGVWPELKPEVSTGRSGDLLGSLGRGELKAAAMFLSQDSVMPKGLTGRVLVQSRLAVISRRDSRRNGFQSISQCNQVGWILNPDGCGFRAALQRRLAEQGVALNVNLDTHSTQVQLEAVARGHGFGLMPLVLLNQNSLRKAVQRIPLKDFSPVVDGWLVSPGQDPNFTPVVERLGRVLVRMFTNRATAQGAAAPADQLSASRSERAVALRP